MSETERMVLENQDPEGQESTHSPSPVFAALRDLASASPNRLLLLLVTINIAFVLLVSATGAVPAPWEFGSSAQAQVLASVYGLFFFVMFLGTAPGRRLWMAMAALLAVGVAMQFLSFGPTEGSTALDSFELRMYGVFLIAGWGALAITAVRYVLAHRSLGIAAPMTLRLGLALASMLFVLACSMYAVVELSLTALFNPRVNDGLALSVSAQYGIEFSSAMQSMFRGTPLLDSIFRPFYQFDILVFPLLIAIQLGTQRRQVWNFLFVFAVLTCASLVTYHLLPLAGPKYAFGDLIIDVPLDLSDFRFSAVLNNLFPRNCMPSMHFGWAYAAWLMSPWLGRRWAVWIFGAFVVAMVPATLGLGEHYLFDIFAAIPYVGAFLCLILHGVPWESKFRQPMVVSGFALYGLYIVAFHLAPETLATSPLPIWTLSILSLVYGWVLQRRLAELQRLVQAEGSTWGYAVGALAPAPRAPASERNKLGPITLMFVLSGFAGLVYEVLYSKQLGSTFGSMAQAAYTVLGTYMGGMAIGAWLGGKIYRRYPHGLALYMLFEAGICVYALISPLLLDVIHVLYVQFATGSSPTAAWLVPLRIALGALLLAPPTVLMGASLPVLVEHLRDQRIASDRSLPLLYGANTIGAAAGALAAGYLIIPTLGLLQTSRLAALMSLLVAWLALRLLKQEAARMNLPEGFEAVRELIARARRRLQETPEAVSAAPPAALGRAALLALFVAGVVTMVIETNYIHLLAVVAGNSTYAFSLMLGTFLLGLACGSLLLGRLPRVMAHPGLSTAVGFLLLGGVLVWGGFRWGELSDRFLDYQAFPLPRTFGAFELVRAVSCFSAMFPPALLIGAIYPVAMRWAAPAGGAREIGIAASLNTVGNIVGVLVGAFLLLPRLGALGAANAAAVLVAIIAPLLVLRSAGTRARLGIVAASAALVLAAYSSPWRLDMTRVANGANVYFQPLGYGEVIDSAESVDGGLTAVSRLVPTSGPPVLTLTTNGKFQGNDAGEVSAQIGLSLAPVMHTAKRDHALVIGYGTGMSARVLKSAGFAQVDIADLSRDVIEMADRHFASVNAGVSQQPGVTTHVVDGRNFLLLQKSASYDLIGMEISSIWFSGAAALYNREFYELARQRLKPGGVMQQWVQLHHMRSEDLIRIIGSMRAAFPYVWFHVIGGQGMAVGSDSLESGPKPEYMDLIVAEPAMKELLARPGVDVDALRASLLLDPAGVDRLLADGGAPENYWVSNDDNMRLEYGTPKGNILEGNASFNENRNLLLRYAKPPH